MLHLLLCFVTLVVSSHAVENCDLRGILIYEDMGCKPVYGNSSECPIRFDCDFGTNNGSCFFKNRYYEPGEVIPNEMLHESCQIGCVCVENGTFACTRIDCSFDILQDGCYWEYDLDQCCPTGQYCPEEPVTCDTHILGYTFRENVVFTAPETCQRCLCRRDRSYSCRRKTCADQAKSADKIQRRCAPSYDIITILGYDTMCCPNSWYCPEDVGEEIDGDDGDDQGDDDPDMFCEFGSRRFKVGEYFKDYSSMFITCSCRTPPLMSCTRY